VMKIKCKCINFSVVLAFLLLCSNLYARPTTADEAKAVVTGWLRSSPQPFGTDLSRQVMDVEIFYGYDSSAAYYIVNLSPSASGSGFVVVSADDLIEPIIGFADDGIYDAAFENPLTALIINDLNGRVSTVRNTYALQTETAGGPQSKWRELISLSEQSDDGFDLMSLTYLSDIRVPPLVQSKWGQLNACGNYCYNYYTPSHYPSGCVATVMAQLMRYHEYPKSGIGLQPFRITVDNGQQTVYTRGGDGGGGPYDWSAMIPNPASNCGEFMETYRQAIGSLCYDAGVAVEMYYESSGSGALPTDMDNALIDVFRFNNAVWAYNNGDNISSGLNEMINSNLDAKLPVILAITGSPEINSGHAVICDGYGYDSSTLYHHLNMGWSGYDDIWYNLPDIDSSGISFTSVFGCLYNIFISGSGEIISGRVLDPDGRPIANAEVTAVSGGRIYNRVLTDGRGVYAIDGLDANTIYRISPRAPGYIFPIRSVQTRNSQDGNATSGNRWGIDFVAAAVLNLPPPSFVYVDDDAPADPGAGDPAISDPSEDGSADHPFDAIQEGIDAAAAGEVVFILRGTYSGEGNRDLDFKGKSITVRGEDPNYPGLVTIRCDGTANEPHRGFNFHNYETSMSVLDGLTITGGYYELGGGVYFGNCARPTVTNCIFTENSALLGGGAYNTTGTVLNNCEFVANSAQAGGGMYNSIDDPGCDPVLNNCVFQDNTASYNGGAIYNSGPTSLELTGCEFIRNSVSDGGGGALYNAESASPALTNCIFIENSAATFGGGIRCSNGGTTTLTNCTFGANSADDGSALACTGDEGGLLSPSLVRIVNCILWDEGDEIYSDDDSTITVNYSNVKADSDAGLWSGPGNINTEPYFADTDSDDYHLKSQSGRWDPMSQSWITDHLTSPCIDAGDTNSSVGFEPSPNGGIINIGAYGGTLQASKSQSGSQQAQ
jgi:predicted outer membrane repeat protein